MTASPDKLSRASSFMLAAMFMVLHRTAPATRALGLIAAITPLCSVPAACSGDEDLPRFASSAPIVSGLPGQSGTAGAIAIGAGPGAGAVATTPVPAGGAPAAPALAPVMPPSASPPIAMPVPADFTKTEVGGFKRGAMLAANQPTTSGSMPAGEAHGCSVMTGVIRDFRGLDQTQGHPDFESFEGSTPTRGLLAPMLGADSKPVYASRCERNPDASACPFGSMTTSRADFDVWYRDDESVNRAYVLELNFQPKGNLYTFQSDAFFPLDGAGFGAAAGMEHNYGFTTEIHATMLYRGGERFSFTGDDDLWVFINGKLAIDLGGLHPPASQSLDLDASAAMLGITPGNSYPLDLFHAERHSTASNFRVDTTLVFTECGTVTKPD